MLPFEVPCESAGSQPLPIKLSRDGKLDELKQLIDRPDQLTEEDRTGVNALMTASQAGWADMVEWLLSTGAFDVNAPDKRGMSPAHFAVGQGHHEILHLLLRAGADPAVEGNRGNGLVRAAVAADCADCLRILLDAGAPLEDHMKGRGLMCLAAQRGNVDALDALSRRGLPLDEPCTANEQTPLSSAAAAGAMRSLRWLLDRNVAVDSEDIIGMTPLMFAASRGQLEAAAALVAAGADVTRTSQIKFDAATYARKNEYLETAVMLEERMRTARAQQKRVQPGPMAA